MTFSANMVMHIFSVLVVTSVPAQMEPVKLAAVELAPANLADTDVTARLKLSEKQLDEVRRTIDTVSKNPKATGAELYAANARLDEIEAWLVNAAAAIVPLVFPKGSTAFKLNADVAKVLIAPAKAAVHVNI